MGWYAMLESFNGNTETILLLGIVVFVVVSLLGLILWNAKTNKQVKTLASIDDSLKHLEFQEAGPKDQESDAQEADTAEEGAALTEEAAEAAPEPEAPAPPDETAIARSGRIYSRQELEALIRD
jgi:hypothetical protein